MKMPFANRLGTFHAAVPPSTHNGSSTGVLGGAAPQGMTVGVRRDFTFVPQFLPSLSISGGLKQPPRG